MTASNGRELAALQAALATWIQADRSLLTDARPDDRQALEGLLAGGRRLSPLAQAEIYREQFWLRHRDALTEDLPALAHFLGQDVFDRFVRAYLAAVPPHSFTLRDLPLGAPAFAASYGGFPESAAAVARELVTYEVAFVRAFDAPEVPGLPVERARDVSPDEWPRVCLSFAPSLAVFSFDHPVHAFRAAVRRGETPSRELAHKPALVAVWRGDDLKVHHAELEPTEHAVLVALMAGQPIGTACAAALGTSAENQLAAWFQSWAGRGWVTDCVVSG